MHAELLSTGAFGSGAAFALEDGWILARAIEHAFYKDARSFVPYSREQALHEALSIFDSIRSPYYLRMYAISISLYPFG
jgi:salicylate hydroxylase